MLWLVAQHAFCFINRQETLVWSEFLFSGTFGKISVNNSDVGRDMTVSALAMTNTSAPLKGGFKRPSDCLGRIARVDVAPKVQFAKVGIFLEIRKSSIIVRFHHI